jgi:hypothetical protein
MSPLDASLRGKTYDEQLTFTPDYRNAEHC